MAISRYYRRLAAQGKLPPKPNNYALCQAEYLVSVNRAARAMNISASDFMRFDARENTSNDPVCERILHRRDEIMFELSSRFADDHIAYAAEMTATAIASAIVRHKRRMQT